MELTAAQQKYFAYWLTRSLPSDSLGKLTASLQDAQVESTRLFLRLSRRSQKAQSSPTR